MLGGERMRTPSYLPTFLPFLPSCLVQVSSVRGLELGVYDADGPAELQGCHRLPLGLVLPSYLPTLPPCQLPTLLPSCPCPTPYRYYASQPHADPARDVSLICGAGRTYMRHAGTVYGKLCDVRIGDALRLSLWSWTFEQHGNRTASWASDGGAQAVEHFGIRRSAWGAWGDQFGKATIPMSQVLEIVTSSHNLTLSFTASHNETGRLTFPLQDTLFSDFEALGATAQVRAVERPVHMHTCTRAHVHTCTRAHMHMHIDTRAQVRVVERRSGALIASFTDDMAGLEFGYRVPTSVPTAA